MTGLIVFLFVLQPCFKCPLLHIFVFIFCTFSKKTLTTNNEMRKRPRPDKRSEDWAGEGHRTVSEKLWVESAVFPVWNGGASFSLLVLHMNHKHT